MKWHIRLVRHIKGCHDAWMPRNPHKIDYSQGLPEGLTAFEDLQAPRTGGRTLHHFGEIIFMALTCIVCGVKSYELMEEFC